MSIEIQPVTDFPCALGEGPLWHPGEQRLYWIDIDGHRLHSWDPSSGGHQTYDTGCPAGCLGLRRVADSCWRPSAGSRCGICAARCRSLPILKRTSRTPASTMGRLTLPGVSGREPTAPHSTARSTGSIRAARSSGCWKGSIFRTGLAGTCKTARCTLPIRPLATSTPSTSICQPGRSRTGAVRRQQRSARVPDGLTVDAEGFIWSVRWGGWRIERFDPDGKRSAPSKLPVEFPTSCCFGGEQLDDLYLTSAAGPGAVSERDKQPLAGGCCACGPGFEDVRSRFRGLSRPCFALILLSDCRGV